MNRWHVYESLKKNNGKIPDSDMEKFVLMELVEFEEGVCEYDIMKLGEE